MSAAGPNSDLEKFREQWRKELDQKGKASEAGSSKSAEDCSELQTYKVSHFSDYSLPPVNAELARVPLQDDNSCDGFEINTFKPHLGAGSMSTTSETHGEQYYPFKILTQFLNEAPKRLESKQTKRALSSPVQSASKRRYFQESQDQKRDKNMPQDDSQVLDKKANPEEEKQMLDIFLADLDEINEIPFFDTSVPREVAIKIFHHLDMKSLCNCSQVSRSWRSLADDELLWFNIYIHLGLGGSEAHLLHVSQGSDWKRKVRRHSEEKQLLVANWKARLGKPYQLNYAQGGVLCAVHSHASTIVAGYTNCKIRLWNTETGDTCTYNASNTALVLDEVADDEEGLCRVENSVQHLETFDGFTAASYTHGFVDVWNGNSGTEPIHTISFSSRNVGSIAVGSPHGTNRHGQVHGNQSVVVAASQGTRVQVAQVSEACGQTLVDFDMPDKVTNLHWLGEAHPHHICNLLVTCNNTVSVRSIELPGEERAAAQTQVSTVTTEIHNVFWAPITAVSLRHGSQDLAVGFNVYAGASAQIKVNLYNLSTQQLTATLSGHTWVISTIHLPESLPGQLVTGSGDRKIRLYDLRAATFPMLTLAGHSARVTSVEMDNWKVLSADEAGFVCVWDQRMARKLWDVHNRHPVDYCHCEERLLIIGNVPIQKFPQSDDFEKVSSLRYRGTVQVYDFLANQQRRDIPNICLSGYDEPEAYDYNIRLAVPYD